jgi:hypothetical protein
VKPRIRDYERLGICPLRELIRRACPGAMEATGPCMSVGDIDLVLRHRADRFDWFGRLRLIEVQLGEQLTPLKAISYGIADYAFRNSPIAMLYDGVYLVNGYADIPRPDVHDDAAIRGWVIATFEQGANINGEHVEFPDLAKWCRGEISRSPLTFKKEWGNIERAVARAA